MKKKINSLNIFIVLFFIITVLYPLLVMLSNVKWSTFSSLISQIQFTISLKNSLFIGIVATIISVLLGFLFAYTINRTNIKHKEVMKILFTIPMLIPSISHGMGLINLFGTNGIFTKIFNLNIIGPTGIIIGSVMYSFPIAFLMINDGFNYIDNTMYDNALVLGMSKWETFKRITFCYLKKPLFSTIFAVFTLIFTDYGVPLSVGGKFMTLPVFLYKEVIGLLDFSKGTIIGLFLLIPAFGSFIFDTFTKDYSNTNFINKSYTVKENKLRDKVLLTISYLMIIFIILVIGSFVYYAFLTDFILDKSFSLIHFKYLIDNDIFKYIFNSLLIALLTSIFGTIIAYFTAYVTARIKGKSSRIIHILAIVSLAIPGIVLGLSYVISFNSTVIYNTFIILVLVNIIHFVASPYLMAYNALQKVNSNYEIVALTCSVSRLRIIKDVIIPITKKTILEMLCYFFVNAMITISAVSFLCNTKTMPLSLLINRFEGNLMLEETAIISLIILFFNLTVKLIIYLINRKDFRRQNNESYT